jgi:hypothetical protein
MRRALLVRDQPHLLGILVALALIGGCTGMSTDLPRLRVTNGGTVLASKLTVRFPMDQIEFGDIRPGLTTAYQPVPNGVYRYAAYPLEINGQMVAQPVIDWVGEQPMDGSAFTYTIAVDAGRPAFQIVQLIAVTKDE